MTKKLSDKGFSLIELMIVVIVVSLIACFSIPAYERAVDRAAEKTALMNVHALKDAVRIYEAERGGNPGILNNISEINTAFQTNIKDVSFNYNCDWDALNGYRCMAVHPVQGWDIHFETTWSEGRIHCGLGGGCPSCPTGDCMYE